jgi:AraC-like DNA-binding protein
MPWCRVLNLTDPVPCEAAVNGSEVQILPTKRGSFHAEITQIGMNRLWMQRFKLSLPLISNCALKVDRKYIGFLLEGSYSKSLHHCGIEVSSNDLVLSGFDELQNRVDSACCFGTMSLPIDDLSSLSKTIIGREFRDKPQIKMGRPNLELMSRLRTLHDVIAQLANAAPDLLANPEVVRALEQQLLHVMIRCLAESTGVESTTGTQQHNVIISRFHHFLEANSDRAVYLAEICESVGASERTLRAACEEHFGMGPIRYLTLRRMHLVHRALLRADASLATVTRIATGHGFWELGRFSVAYRALFGELPSETLRRPVQDTEIPFHPPSSSPRRTTWSADIGQRD